MDGQKFDDLIKQFCATRLTRWDALRGLVAGAAAAITGSALVADDVDAKKGRNGAKAEGKDKRRGSAKAEGNGKNKGRGAKAQGNGKNKGRRDAKKKGSNRKGAVRAQQVGACEATKVGEGEGNNRPCPSGIRLEAGREFKQGKDECGTTKAIDCGNGQTCQIRFCLSGGGTKISLEPAGNGTACPITSVFVKAGSGFIEYRVDGTCAIDLTGPGNKEISHVDICIGTCPPVTTTTTTTTEAPTTTTTTTEAPTTTTTQAVVICEGNQSPKQCPEGSCVQYTCKGVASCPQFQDMSKESNVEVKCRNGVPYCEGQGGVDLTSQGCLPTLCANPAGGCTPA